MTNFFYLLSLFYQAIAYMGKHSLLLAFSIAFTTVISLGHEKLAIFLWSFSYGISSNGKNT